MNELNGTIRVIQTAGQLSLVDVTVADHTLSVILIETPDTAPYLRDGQQVRLAFKETEVILASPDSTFVSIENRLPVEVVAVEAGQILSRIELTFIDQRLDAFISTRVAQRMNLAPGQKMVALIKMNEITIITRERK